MKYPYEYAEIISKQFEILFFVDLETTGLDAMRNEILTASLSVVDYNTLEEIDSIDLKFRPEVLQHWSKEAEAIHGISLPMALSFPEKAESTRKLLEFLSKHRKDGVQPMVCHALNFKGGYFDTNYLAQHFFRTKDDLLYFFRRVCGITESTIDYAKALGGFENYKLGTLCKHYSISLDHHDARSDRMACQALYKIFRETKV